jgi:hypothetical protein
VALTLIEKLYGLEAADLGASVEQWSGGDSNKSLSLVLDIAPPLVAGSVLNAAVFVGDKDAGFTSAFDGAPIQWSTSLDNPDTLVDGAAYAAFHAGESGDKRLRVQIKPPGETAVDFIYDFSHPMGPQPRPGVALYVLDDQPRLHFANAIGTPQADPRIFKMFVYNYRNEIMHAARLTGWPQNNAGNPNGICPRLLAAVFFPPWSF